jgi:ATP-binding cassette subfamily B protein
MRFYDVQKGQILLDGQNIASLDLNYLRRTFAVVLQDVFLFSGTLESNIRLGSDISHERIVAAARDVNLMPFYRQLAGWPRASVSTNVEQRCRLVSASCWRSRAPWPTILRF